jgi:hypothetical protein
MNELSKIFRYGEPGKLDTAKIGTECWIVTNKELDEYDVYQQVSTNEENPNWIYIGKKNGTDGTNRAEIT